MVERYGDFVLYKPQLKKSTWILWFGPLIVLLLGLVVMARIVSGRRAEQRSADVDPASIASAPKLSAEEQKRFDQLLRSNPSDSKKS